MGYGKAPLVAGKYTSVASFTPSRIGTMRLRFSVAGAAEEAVRAAARSHRAAGWRVRLRILLARNGFILIILS